MVNNGKILLGGSLNILLVCSYFGPETCSGVNRVNSFVRHWLGKGATIDVITMPYENELPAYLHDQKGLTVYQVAPFFLPKKTQSFGGSHSTTRIKKILHWLKKIFFANYLDPRSLWWPKAAFVANNVCHRKKIDFVITSVPSYTAHSIGAVIKRLNPKIMWVADYRDLWSGNPIFPGFALVRLIERWHEQYIIKQANLLVTINLDLANALASLHGGKKIVVVPNGFEYSDFDADRSEDKEKKEYTLIVYTGTVLPGLHDPEPLFRAIVNLIASRLISDRIIKLFFYGDASAIRHTDAFRYLLKKEVIHLKGRVPRHLSLQAQQAADLLLFLGARTLNGGADVKGVVSGKIFEYLLSGVEVLAVGVTDQMIVGEMIQLAEVGDVYAEDVDKIQKRILSLIENGPKKITPNMMYLDQFNRSNQASWLLSEIEKELS